MCVCVCVFFFFSSHFYSYFLKFVFFKWVIVFVCSLLLFSRPSTFFRRLAFTRSLAALRGSLAALRGALAVSTTPAAAAALAVDALLRLEVVVKGCCHGWRLWLPVLLTNHGAGTAPVVVEGVAGPHLTGELLVSAVAECRFWGQKAFQSSILLAAAVVRGIFFCLATSSFHALYIGTTGFAALTAAAAGDMIVGPAGRNWQPHENPRAGHGRIVFGGSCDHTAE